MNKLTILFLLIGTIAFGQAESLDNGYTIDKDGNTTITATGTYFFKGSSIPIASNTVIKLKDDLVRGYWMPEDITSISTGNIYATISQSNSMQLGTIATIDLETGEIDIQKLPVEEASRKSAKLFWDGWEQYFMGRIEQERRTLNDKAIEKIDGIASVVVEMAKSMVFQTQHRNDLLKQIKILNERQKLLNDHFLKHYKMLIQQSNLSM